MNYLAKFKDGLEIYAVEKAKNLGRIKPSMSTIAKLKFKDLKSYKSKK